MTTRENLIVQEKDEIPDEIREQAYELVGRLAALSESREIREQGEELHRRIGVPSPEAWLKQFTI
jgi:hypothetical protein